MLGALELVKNEPIANFSVNVRYMLPGRQSRDCRHYAQYLVLDLQQSTPRHPAVLILAVVLFFQLRACIAATYNLLHRL